VLSYDFTSSFTIGEGRKASEDIYVTLNMSLYSWLTILRKTFAREMDQANAAADVRTGSGTSASQSLAGRRKALDPLVIPSQIDVLTASPEPLERTRARSPYGSISRPHARSTASLPAIAHSPDTEHRSPETTSPSSRHPTRPLSPSHLQSPLITSVPSDGPATSSTAKPSQTSIIYEPRQRHIERLTMRQLGDATPDVMHPFFMKKAGFSLEDSLPQYVHEYATVPTESIMKMLLKIYSKQLNVDQIPDTQP